MSTHTSTDSSAPYPAFLDLRGVPVVVVGGGKVAARKVADLLDAGARVNVVSPDFDPDISTLKSQSLTLVQRFFRPSDLKGQRLVFAATNNPDLNATICATAEKKGVWSNCAAPPEAGSFAVPATVRQGQFCLAISTGGASPALTAHWRKRLEKIVGAEWGELAALLQAMRAEAKAQIADPEKRRALLSELGKPHWARKIKKYGINEVKRQMKAMIAKAGVSGRE